MPRDDSNEISVFRIDGLTEDEIWKIWENSVNRTSNRTLYGRAEITTLEVETQDLQVIPDNESNRHANITGWPTEKSKRLQIAQELAAIATLILKQ